MSIEKLAIKFNDILKNAAKRKPYLTYPPSLIDFNETSARISLKNDGATADSVLTYIQRGSLKLSRIMTECFDLGYSDFFREIRFHTSEKDWVPTEKEKSEKDNYWHFANQKFNTMPEDRKYVIPGIGYPHMPAYEHFERNMTQVFDLDKYNELLMSDETPQGAKLNILDKLLVEAYQRGFNRARQRSGKYTGE